MRKECGVLGISKVNGRLDRSQSGKGREDGFRRQIGGGCADGAGGTAGAGGAVVVRVGDLVAKNNLSLTIAFLYKIITQKKLRNIFNILMALNGTTF